MSSKRHHTIISGTGRAGTTFLIELLTRLGLETGFAPDASIDHRAYAGLERDIRNPNTPYIAKSPWYCDWLPELLADGTVVIDNAIIAVRDLAAAANSRARITALAHAHGETQPPGGLWHTDHPDRQIAILYRQLSMLLETLARFDIPVTLIWYPRPQY